MPDNQIPIVGEPFKDYVDGQIKTRQSIYGSGFNSHRTPQQISYLNSRTSWIKVASSVNVLSSPEGAKRLRKMGLDAAGNNGLKLAQTALLFNSLSKNDNSQRSGVATSNSLINNSAYGFGGTEFGIQPPPGIESFSITHENRGSIRTATLKVKAYNKFQFELIELLYLRLGYTMMIEWGNSVYFDNNDNFTINTNSLIDEYWFKTQGDSQLTVLDKIETKRKATNGNYDALFGKVVNFDWTFTPEGTYDINIKFASLGDVVESFKINALPPRAQFDESSTKSSSGESLSEEELNKNIVTNYFSELKKAKKEDVFNVDDKDNPLYKNLVAVEAGEVDRSTKVNENQGVRLKDRYYIRLGHLLDFLWREGLIFYKSKGGECYPVFDIDLSNQSLMRSFKSLISIDPLTCIVNNPHVYSRYFEGNTPKWIYGMEPFFKDEDGNTAIINNIYLNFELVANVFKNNIDSKGNLTYYNFITSLLNKINNSFANICDLELTINDEKVMSIIRDAKLPSKTDNNGQLLTSNSTPIQVYGYKNGESNFVKNYSFVTQISNELANMLTIGATANNTIVNEDATAFEKWNQGLEDRFRIEGTNSKPDSCKARTENNVLTGSPKDLNFSWFQNIKDVNEKQANTLQKRDKFSSKEEKNKEMQKLINAEYKSYDKYLDFAFKSSVDTVTNKYSVLGGYYFLCQESFKLRGLNALKNTIKTRYKNKYEKTSSPSSNVGFIPLELSLEIDGLSGIKIYNQLVIDTEFLPPTYPDTMEFVVMGVDHELNENNWTTNIRAISKPKSIPPANNTSNNPSYAPEGYGAPQN